MKWPQFADGITSLVRADKRWNDMLAWTKEQIATDGEREEFLEHALPILIDYVWRQAQAEIRREAVADLAQKRVVINPPVASPPTPSVRAEKVREWFEKWTQQTIRVTESETKPLGECTPADLKIAATHCRRIAAVENFKANRLDVLANLVAKAQCGTVGMLPVEAAQNYLESNRRQEIGAA